MVRNRFHAVVHGVIGRRGASKSLYVTIKVYNYLYSPFCPKCKVHFFGYPVWSTAVCPVALAAVGARERLTGIDGKLVETARLMQAIPKGEADYEQAAQLYLELCEERAGVTVPKPNHDPRSKQSRLWIFSNYCETCRRFHDDYPLARKVRCPQCMGETTCPKDMGLKVFSNYFLQYADAHHPHIVGWLTGEETGVAFPAEAENGFILLDEANAISRSERTMATDSVLLATFMEQIRKRGLSIFWTAQNPRKFHPDVRWQTDFYEMPSTPNKGRTVYLKTWDREGTFTGKFHPEEWSPERKPDREFKLVAGGAEPYRYWGMYDTDETITPTIIWKKRREAEKKAARGGPVVQTISDEPGRAHDVAQLTRLEKIFSKVTHEGLDYSALQRNFAVNGWNTDNLDYEIESRGLEVRKVRRKKMVFPK